MTLTHDVLFSIFVSYTFPPVLFDRSLLLLTVPGA